MIEAGLVLGLPKPGYVNAEILYRHTPNNSTGGSLPDSKDLWQVMWDNRDHLLGFAHSHPGGGRPSPSYTDLTTFAAIEAGLGARLVWWIVNGDNVSVVRWCGPGKLEYENVVLNHEPFWAAELRQLSGIDNSMTATYNDTH